MITKSPFEIIQTEIESLKELAAMMIAEQGKHFEDCYTPSSFIEEVTEKTKIYYSLDKLKIALEQIRSEIEDIHEKLDSGQADIAEVSQKKLRYLTIELSQGMINQSMLTLTRAKQKGLVHIGEKFHITLRDGSSFETELSNPGNRLTARKPIKQFYEEESLSEGDTIILEEFEPNKWKLTKRNINELLGL